MQSLREMQTGFAAAIFNAGASSLAPDIRADGISPATRLGVYRTNVFENYRKALGLTFSATERIVGSGFFAALAEEYVRSCPSRSGDVGRHGERFPEFLRHHRCSRELPYLADLARLEWCIDESFNEADADPLDLQRLAAVREEHCERLRFQLAPSCRLLSSCFPINRIWDLCQPDHDGEVNVGLGEGGVDLLVRRRGFAVVVEALDPGELAMLMALSTGHEFAAAYQYARAADDSFDPAAFLSKHVLSRVLVDFTLPAETHAP
jgi:Putative DNA-binding domain